MTVHQIIQEIEKFSPEEKVEIKAFLSEQDKAAGVVQYADRDKAMAIADKIFTERAELFQKLAQ